MTEHGSRQRRVAARDAAMRRISWWTAALAAGGLAGTVGVAVTARAAAEAEAAGHPTVVQPVQVDDELAEDVQPPTPPLTATSTRSEPSRSTDVSRSKHRTSTSNQVAPRPAPAPVRTTHKKVRAPQPPVKSAGS